jgi:hypothetical protein
MPPFDLFPPGYPKSLFPVAHVTHTHGLVVAPDQDGTAEEWFTPNLQFVGPSYRTSTYTMPNEQSPTALFHHDHVMGVTRIGLYSGVVGTAYFIRDPANTPLDGPHSPLPTGQFEIPLALSARQFYTDGNFDFPPARGTLNSANANDQNGGGGLATSAFLALEVLPVLYTLWRQHQLRRADRLAVPIANIVGAVPSWARE